MNPAARTSHEMGVHVNFNGETPNQPMILEQGFPEVRGSSAATLIGLNQSVPRGARPQVPALGGPGAGVALQTLFDSKTWWSAQEPGRHLKRGKARRRREEEFWMFEGKTDDRHQSQVLLMSFCCPCKP